MKKTDRWKTYQKVEAMQGRGWQDLTRHCQQKRSVSWVDGGEVVVAQWRSYGGGRRVMAAGAISVSGGGYDEGGRAFRCYFVVVLLLLVLWLCWRSYLTAVS